MYVYVCVCVFSVETSNLWSFLWPLVLNSEWLNRMVC